MADVEAPESGPSLSDLAPVFRVDEAQQEGDTLLYYGYPVASRDAVMRHVWPLFRDRDYEVTLTRRSGRYVLKAEPVDIGIDGVPWTNIVLAIATVISTLWVGSMWYYVRDPLADPLATVAEAWPFTVAVLGVLGIHELGHYVMSRYHNVDATLPYFIPMPTIIGTMGAVIRMKGQMPNRKALFDIGVAGPLAGLAATIVVTAIGLTLDPIEVPAWVLNSPYTQEIRFGYPPLFEFIAMVVGQPIGYEDPRIAVNPVVFGGWVGMFVTFLNLIPVGQLDGGHIMRSILGRRVDTLSALVPGALFGLAGYLYYFGNAGNAVGIWVMWGLFALILAYAGSATPIRDQELDTRRKLLGAFTFLLGLLCFTPVPVQIVT